MTNRTIEVLAWDSAHFGRRIARAARRQVDANTCGDMLAECRSADIDCLYFLADAADQQSIAALQFAGFELIDIRLTLSAQFQTPPEFVNWTASAFDWEVSWTWTNCCP